MKTKNQKKKQQGAKAYGTDRENEVSKTLITTLGNRINLETKQSVLITEYGALNQPITAHEVPEI